MTTCKLPPATISIYTLTEDRALSQAIRHDFAILQDEVHRVSDAVAQLQTDQQRNANFVTTASTLVVTDVSK